MLGPLLLLFIIVPLLELAVILQVGQVVGFWWTIGLLVADSLLGAVLMRAQGRAAWERFIGAMRAGRPPAREVLDGAMVMGGGALLLTPGFLTDGVGLLLLLPPTRAAIRRTLARRLLERMMAREVGARPAGPFRPAPSQPYDVEGSASDVDSERSRPPRAPETPARGRAQQSEPNRSQM